MSTEAAPPLPPSPPAITNQSNPYASNQAPAEDVGQPSYGTSGPTMQESMANNASTAMNNSSNHPATQTTKDTLTKGPVAQSVKNQGAITSDEFSGLANSRQQPQMSAATGEALTNYHSFFFTLLSWQNPRATSISFVISVLFIFASRYLPLLKWMLKLGYLTFGVTAAAEIVGKLVTGNGMTASLRPRKYYRVPKEKLEVFLDDVEQLINFFVIEFQRILFAENIAATVGAFFSALISYYLIKILPVWGLALTTTCIIYMAPLIYVKNKDLIDGQVEHASQVVSAQTAQFRNVAGQRTSQGLSSMKHYGGEYASKAQVMVGNARQKIPVPGTSGAQSQSSTVNESQFPQAPNAELAGRTSTPGTESAPGGPIAAS